MKQNRDYRMLCAHLLLQALDAPLDTVAARYGHAGSWAYHKIHELIEALHQHECEQGRDNLFAQPLGWHNNRMAALRYHADTVRELLHRYLAECDAAQTTPEMDPFQQSYDQMLQMNAQLTAINRAQKKVIHELMETLEWSNGLTREEIKVQLKKVRHQLKISE